MLFYLTENINFQKALLIIAIIALTLAILVSAYKLNSAAKTTFGQSWPPLLASCPDYWDLSGNYCVNSSWQNIGKLNYTPLSSGDILYDSQVPTCTDASMCVIPLHTMGVERGKRKNRSKNSKKNWASMYGFVWDGLTSDGVN